MTMQRIFFFISALLLACQLQAATPSLEDADSAYRQENYALAAQRYHAVLQQEEARDTASFNTTQAACHYNLGNCYYRMKDLAHAVLHYRRALRLQPDHKEAAFNLELTQTKLADQFDEPSEMFFISWTKELVQSESSTTWGWWGIGLFVLAFLLGMAYWLGQRVWLRKVSFFGALATLLFSFCCELFAFLQQQRFENERHAVVMKTADTFSTPSTSGKKVQTLHEGTTLRLIDTYKNGWVQAELPSGTVIWMKATALEKV